MSAFPEWRKYAVHQRRNLSGCIPTGYEFLLRASGVPGIDFDSFQDDFDLDKDLEYGGIPRNNFESVALQVNNKYPNIRFRQVIFPKGASKDKLVFVEENIANHRPVLVSLNMLPFNLQGWHIMPVVDLDETNLFLLNGIDDTGQAQVIQLSKDIFMQIHEQLDGGDDVAYLQEQT